MRSPGFWAAVAGAVLRRPALWGTAITLVARLAAPGWWRRAPFLPLPEMKKRIEPLPETTVKGAP